MTLADHMVPNQFLTTGVFAPQMHRVFKSIVIHSANKKAKCNNPLWFYSRAQKWCWTGGDHILTEDYLHPQPIPVTANIVACPAPQWKSISYIWMIVPPSIPQIFLEILSEVLSTSLCPCSEQHKRLHCSYTR